MAHEYHTLKIMETWNASPITVDPFRGEAVKVTVEFSEQLKWSLVRGWYVARDSQFRGLLVVTEFQDGQRVWASLEIPHRSTAPSVSVGLP